MKRAALNALASKTDDKILVLESDDWGSLRMPSREVHAKLSRLGISVGDHYNRFDSLESAEDLDALLGVLANFRGSDGRPAVLTANFLVANPDFERIRLSEFSTYCHEPFTQSYARTRGCESSFEKIQAGMRENLLRPQLHGREHLNVPLWLEALASEDEETVHAFEVGVWGQATRYRPARRGHFMAAFDYRNRHEALQATKTASEGAAIFARTFGARPVSFIAPNYIWDGELEVALAKQGISRLQGQRRQLLPEARRGPRPARWHFTGQRGRAGQTYLVRNAMFEPASDPTRDWVRSCLGEIASAFAWRTPAIIGVHRVNFMGRLDLHNRDRNLRLLGDLLGEILRRWPGVRFRSSDNALPGE